jgi:hydrogenase maturation protein HypF
MTIEKERLRVAMGGAVQGVGFRPYVYRLATELKLAGWVRNGAHGVVLEVEGAPQALRRFLVRLPAEIPPHAVVTSLEPSFLDAVGYDHFEIEESQGGEKTALVLPDIATCAECRREIFDSANRRYLYPFTNCTHCGPRYSFLESLPYDRAHTSMKSFRMCRVCQAEYDNPEDRRFHAQPNACSDCGPHLELWNRQGDVVTTQRQALTQTAEALAGGKIVAIKGLGGFQLWVDARNDSAVQALRQRKHRQEKPFAVMAPTLEWAKRLCEISEMEERLLLSAEAPIVLLRRKNFAMMDSPPVAAGNDVHKSSPPSVLVGGPSAVAESVAPRNPYLGLMLPYTPLHHLLLHFFPYPVVATSANLSEEPICIDEKSALRDLEEIADLFLVHNRPIVRPVDDSVAAVVEERELLLRRARGYAPLPILTSLDLPKVLAVGAHLKNTVAISIGRQAFVSQHIGDLETAGSFDCFKQTIESLQGLYAFAPESVACDLHPNYVSTRYAEETRCQVLRVQHHYAHVLSCMADNGLEGSVLGVAWDGTGAGLDHTIWGGEFLRVTPEGFERQAHLRTFRLPGGKQAVREPRRAALGLLFEHFGEAAFDFKRLNPLKAFTETELTVFRAMLAKGIQSPRTSSVGRLFDAVASLIGLRQAMTFEGQAAMELEFCLPSPVPEGYYPINMSAQGASWILDWAPMLGQILDDLDRGVPASQMSALFHNALVEALVEVVRRSGEHRVVLTGGCFQNRYLASRAIRRLRAEGFAPYWHQRVPPNDGGLSLGQVIAAARVLKGAAVCA